MHERHEHLIDLPAPVRRVLGAITAAGGHPFLVGGAVRDALAGHGHSPKDLDVEVYGVDLDTLTAALARVARVDEVGKAFAVLKVRAGGIDLDVSVPRREVAVGSGHRAFTIEPDPHATLEAATARRDFTINALMWDPATGDVVDCWGGLADLAAGVLRHVSDAFGEDPLRVLRAAGFAARFGFTLDPGTAAVARSLVHTFGDLSVERVWGEWHKIVTRGGHPSAALAVLVDTGWDVHFPELAALRGIPQDPTWHPEGDVFTHAAMAGDVAAAMADEAGLTGTARAVVVLAALLHDTGKVTHTQHKRKPDGTEKITSHGHAEAGVRPTRAFLHRIGAPAEVIAQVVPLVAEHMASVMVTTPSATVVRRLARRLFPATIEQWALVVSADRLGRGAGATEPGTEVWLSVADEVGSRQAPAKGILRGTHLIDAGLRPSPQFKVLLNEALVAQDDGAFADEAGAVAWLDARLAAIAS